MGCLCLFIVFAHLASDLENLPLWRGSLHCWKELGRLEMSGSSGCTCLFVPGQGGMIPSFSLKESGKREEKLLEDDSQKESMAWKWEKGHRWIQFSVIPKIPKCEGTKVNHRMFRMERTQPLKKVWRENKAGKTREVLWGVKIELGIKKDLHVVAKQAAPLVEVRQLPWRKPEGTEELRAWERASARIRLSGEGDKGPGKEFVMWWQKKHWNCVLQSLVGSDRQTPSRSEKCSHIFAHNLGQLGL